MYDLISSPKPGISASSFNLNDTLDNIFTSLGGFKVIAFDSSASENIKSDAKWILKKKPLGLNGEFYETLVYKKECIELVFHSGILTDIILGNGYMGSFLGLHIGDVLPNSVESYELIFNDQQDEFLLMKDNEFLDGISIGTDCRSPLKNIPLQLIKKIRVFRPRLTQYL